MAVLVGHVAPPPPLLEYPRGEADGRVGQPERRGLRLGSLQLDIAPLRVAVRLSRFEPLTLRGRQRQLVYRRGHHAEVDPDQAIGMTAAKRSGNRRSPVAAVRTE